MLKRQKRSFFVSFCNNIAPLSSSSLFMLHTSFTTEHKHLSNFAHLHFFCTAYHHRDKAEAPPQNPFPHYIFALKERMMLLPSKRYKTTVFPRNCFHKKKPRRTYGHRAPCKNSLIGNHFIAHSENAGAIVHSPKPLKPPSFHFTVNNDLW